jgi:DNA helicase-2/ATP-dependent DNA helicase PcrA
MAVVPSGDAAVCTSCGTPDNKNGGCVNSQAVTSYSPDDLIFAVLNPQQREAVSIVEGPLLILAGAGSGKTRVLTHRIAHLVRNCGVPPARIMAVTFTNKAAGEMRERLYRLIGPYAAGLTLGTFHSVCARILREHAHRLGLSSGFAIYDDSDQVELVKRVLKELDLGHARISPEAICGAISRAKDDLIDPVHYARRADGPFEELVAQVYRRYEVLLFEANALDFGDLIMRTVQLFQEHPQVLQRYQERYLHILVDEYQDTNRAQYVLVRLLSEKHRNLCVVGDDDQSIYSWRGADIRNILSFEHDFPDAKVVKLEQNYRSTQRILDAAHGVVSGLLRRKPKRLWTENGEGAPVVLFEAYNEQEEAQYVVREIDRLVRREAFQYGDCAVIYRTHAQSRAIEQAMIRAGMPYQLVGGTKFYERREIKDLLAYLRLIANPRDLLSFERIVNVPPRGIGPRTVDELLRWAARLGVPPTEAAQLYALELETGEQVAALPAPFSPRSGAAVAALGRLFAELAEACTRLQLLDFVTLVLERSGYRAWLNDGTPEGQQRLENVEELLTVARDFDRLPPGEGLLRFLEEVSLVTDVDELESDADAVKLMTVHNTKGLEFPVVFMVGMEERVFPHSRSLDDPDRLEEERRLCYVGMTRAMQRLYLVYAFRRTLFGRSEQNTPSRFLADIPPHVLDAGALPARPAASAPLLRPVVQPRRERADGVPPLGTQPQPRRPAVVQAQYQVGDRVYHPHFGKGMVVRSDVIGTDEEVTVVFEKFGIKKLSASFAPLTRLHARDEGE